ncbi:archaetidylserine decarboxylase [Ostreibacterium oceani]|uniref:phosphatidylserine decarboxylase n=1 Tax=Ostreibacterium oceani TaxID=2654998 RepID=A0A6N7EVY6_9GAMM|nr:archaetidylserine decarboxylase [Ostreibacterium oceani]MPV86662.1 phosphatidylserine decarboxylase [Ostreibacterium oceani]
MHPTIHRILPKKLLSALMYRSARIRQPQIKSLLIRFYMRITGASLHDAARQRIAEYDSLLDFFTRELAPNARPIYGNETDWICPVDGQIAHIGDIQEGNIFQIKGHHYALTDLLTSDYCQGYENGQATTIYLAPHNYHRIHIPYQANLKRARYVPGALNSVSVSLLKHIQGLFAKNERVILEFACNDNSDDDFIMVLVGAVNVGSIETVYHGEITPNGNATPMELAGSQHVSEKGAEIGRFNLGSTIILIRKNRQLTWCKSDNETCQLGQILATPKDTQRDTPRDTSATHKNHQGLS